MEILVYMLAAYGLVFGIQQKLPTIRSWHPRGLLDCAYCLGWWVGGATWGLLWAVRYQPLPWAQGSVWGSLGGIVWAFATAGFCELLEALYKGGAP